MRSRLVSLGAVLVGIFAVTGVASAKPIFMPNLQQRLAQQNALHGTGTSGGITPPAPPCPENGLLYPPPSQWPSAVPYLFSNCGITELPATGLPIPGNMAYYGGHVQVHPKEYLVYWGWGQNGAFPNQTCAPETIGEGEITATLQCDPDGAGKYMADFVHQMGGTDWANVSTQFFQTGSTGISDYISNDKNVLAGIWVDDKNDITSLAKTSSSAPAGSGNTYWDLAEEALRAAAHFGVSGAALADANFIILQPPAYSDPNALNAGYCAFHDFTDPNISGNSYYDGLTMPNGASAPYIQYSNIPYQIAPALASGCGEGIEGGKLDGFSVVLGHEIEETITDPGAEDLDPKTSVEYGGWYDAVDADENGDKCAWVGDALGVGLVGAMPGAVGEMTGNAGTKFPVQSIWSNADNAGTGYCAGAGTDSPVPPAAYGNTTGNDLPANTVAPTISGTPAVGQTLTASNDSWTQSPSAYVYQWQRCDSSGQNCVDIDGATASTYTPGSNDVANTLAVEEYAANVNGSSLPVASAPTSVVTATAPTTSATPSDTGTITSATNGTAGGAPASTVSATSTTRPVPAYFTYVPLACPAQARLTLKLPARRGALYKEALVYVNGRLAAFLHGRRLTRVSLARPLGRRFTLELVGVATKGKRVRITWRYDGCSRTLVKPRKRRKA